MESPKFDDTVLAQQSSIAKPRYSTPRHHVQPRSPLRAPKPGLHGQTSDSGRNRRERMGRRTTPHETPSQTKPSITSEHRETRGNATRNRPSSTSTPQNDGSEQPSRESIPNFTTGRRLEPPVHTRDFGRHVERGSSDSSRQQNR